MQKTKIAIAFAVALGFTMLVSIQETIAGHFSIGQNLSDSLFSQSGFIPPDTMGAVVTCPHGRSSARMLSRRLRD